MKCHYEVLEIPRDATDDDIKKAYRKLALKWHPDKNMDSLQEAKDQFQLIQQAYEVLSNPGERRWYDKHRDDIIISGSASEKNKNIINVFEYYTSSCYSGFGDDEKGFFSVYRRLFEDLTVENAQFSTGEESDEDVPGFGDQNISYEGLRRFYSYWRGYNTTCSFAWLDIYDITKAPNRQAAKLMEKENKRIRNKAKRERNDQVRNLVDFIRRRDPRISKFGKMFELMTEEKKKKSQEFRKQQLLKRQKEVQEQKESEWSKFSNIQPDLESVEAAVTKEFGEESPAEDDTVPLYCIACTKIFKTQKAFSNHENSKKHKDNVLALKSSLSNDDNISESKLSSDESSNSSPAETKLATGPEMLDDLLNAPSSSKNNERGSETSDEERISDSDLNVEGSNENESNNGRTFKSATDGGYIFDEPEEQDDQDKEDGYDTPNDELFSDHEDELLAKSKKQKKKKSKIIQMPNLDDSDDENNGTGLPIGLSKKQMKKRLKEKVLLDKLANNIKTELNTNANENTNTNTNADANVNIKEKSEKSTSSSSERNQGKVNESEDSPQETVSPLPEKKKGKKAKELRKAQRQAAREAREAREIFDLCHGTKISENIDPKVDDWVFKCVICSEQFFSRNKLFHHLRATSHGKMFLKNRDQEQHKNLFRYYQKKKQCTQ